MTALPDPPLTSSILAYNPFFPNGIVSDAWGAYFTALSSTIIAGPVVSFNERTGAVVPQTGDYPASLIPFTQTGPGAVPTTADAKFKQMVSVLDFGAVGDGVTDDTAAIQAALNSGAMRVYFPNKPSKYYLSGSASVTIPRGVVIYGDSWDQAGILCNTTGSDGPFFILGAYGEMDSIQISGNSSARGILVQITGGAFTFTGNNRMNNVRLITALTGLDIQDVYNSRITGCEFRSCGTGIEISPATNGGDNGYANTLTFTNCYFLGNISYDVHAAPAVRVSNLAFRSCTFDAGPATAKVYTKSTYPLVFDDCYFEGGSSTPSISLDTSIADVRGCYLLNTGGITCSATNTKVAIRSCRFAPTDVITGASSLNFWRIQDSNLPASGNTFSSSNKTSMYFENSSVNGVSYTNFPDEANTWSAIQTISNATASTTPGTGALVISTGGLGVGGNITGGSNIAAISASATLISSTCSGPSSQAALRATNDAGTSVEFRINGSAAGVNPGDGQFTYTGTGTLRFFQNGTSRLEITSASSNFKQPVHFVASTSSAPSANIPVGVADASPVAGDLYNDANGTLQFKGNFQASGYTAQKVGTPVASAATITPTGPVFPVSGAATINTINLPYTGFTGTITLIPTGKWSTGTSGNIAQAITANIGQEIRATFDGTKWQLSFLSAAFGSVAAAAPTGTTSTTSVMMGIGLTVTPTRSGVLVISGSGQMANSTLNDGATVQLYYGTGTAPVNGAAVTGTAIGTSQTHASLVAADTGGWSFTVPVPNLTQGTTYWIDVALKAVTGGTATVTGVTVSAVEM